MSGTADYLRIAFTFGPVLMLVLVGLTLTLHSGLQGASPRVVVGKLGSNLLHATALVAMCLVTLAAVQQLVGFRIEMAW